MDALNFLKKNDNKKKKNTQKKMKKLRQFSHHKNL